MAFVLVEEQGGSRSAAINMSKTQVIESLLYMTVIWLWRDTELLSICG